MGAGPLIAAAGLLLFQRVGVKADYVSEVLPPLLVFSLGLSMTVAPLTAAVLAGSEHQAGIASGVNNAIARVAGLLGTASRRRGDRLRVRDLDRQPPAGHSSRRRGPGGGARSQAAAARAARRPRRARRAGARRQPRRAAGFAAQLSPGHDDRRRARRARGRGGGRGDSQPAGRRRARFRMRGRAAGGGEQARGGRCGSGEPTSAQPAGSSA